MGAQPLAQRDRFPFPPPPESARGPTRKAGTRTKTMGAAESRSHLEESTSVPVLTINGEIEDETGREAGFASEVTPEQAAAAEG